MKFLSILILSLMAQFLAYAQDPVMSLKAVRTTQKIVIDGDIADEAWKLAPMASGFTEWRPAFGKKEEDKNRTEVRILYDNAAIYISGFCHEASNDSISNELVGRDVVGVNDFIGVIFDTYHDKINGFGYFVTALGEQFDAKYSSQGEDPSWNSVYETAAKIVNGGWTFEMKIPYSAIRFSNTSGKQDWGINITRRRNKSGKQFMWSPTNPTIGGNFLAQFGTWTGIENIKPPIRLSFSPYLSTYANHYPLNDPNKKNFSMSVNGGMDVKYGINQAFTLDMTLIPDFGQVQSDNQVLNLTPFEVKFNENRTFFTEGTDLFGKGNLFYSRRIGGQPIHYGDVYNQLSPGETVIRNPGESKLLNATKISGRTSSGLGIGVFNAITRPQYATIEKNSKETRQLETDPLTNYNIIVLDQSLRNNSSVSFINTNVTRSGTDYDANVTAVLWDLYDKKNNWNLNGKIGESQLLGFLPGGKNLYGYTHDIGIRKTGGRFNLQISQELADQKFTSNDMGYFTNNNFVDHNFWMGYKWLKPRGIYNRLNLNLMANYSSRFQPWDYQNARIGMNLNGQLKSLWYAGLGFNYRFVENDFYEPRIAGRVFRRPDNITMYVWLESNRAKKYSAAMELNYIRSWQYNATGYDISFRNNYRFNKKLTVSSNTSFLLINNNLGFATTSQDSSLFALRKRNTIENVLNIKYNFNNKMGLSLRTRHYWSRVDNRQFFNLQPDGGLTPIAAINRNVNYNVNYFNVDMVYTWQFALGSFINVVWKNAIGTYDQNTESGYFKNLGSTLEANQLNSLSVRIIYFLDYLSLKKK